MKYLLLLVQIQGLATNLLNLDPVLEVAALKKDLLNLIYLCKYFGLKEVASYWLSVVSLNSWNQNRISEIVVNKLFGTLAEKKIVILGFAFKANTNDTRESSAITISKNLLIEGANLKIHDPKVSSNQIKAEFKLIDNKSNYQNTYQEDLNNGSWEKIDNIYEAFIDADAAIVLTEWEEYSGLDWEKISKLMRKPSWVFDTRSIVNYKDNFKNGYQFMAYWNRSKLRK